MCEALGKLSHPAAFVSAIGDDVAGNVIADSLFPHVEHIARVRDGRTAQCMVILDGAGDCKFLVGDMDIHSRITPEIVRGKEELIRNARMVVLDGNPTLDTMEIVLRLAGEFNVPVLFEPTDVPICQKPFKTKFWQSIKYITPNFNELKYIAKSLNLNIPNTKDNINNACELAKEVAEYIENVVVTLGADGLVIARRNSAKTKLLQPPGDKEIEVRHYPGLVVDGLVNVSGAGDCFAAGLIIGMLEGLVEEECVAVGLASAVCALKSASTVPETLKRESVVNEDLDVANYVSY